MYETGVRPLLLSAPETGAVKTKGGNIRKNCNGNVEMDDLILVLLLSERVIADGTRKKQAGSLHEDRKNMGRRQEKRRTVELEGRNKGRYFNVRWRDMLANIRRDVREEVLKGKYWRG